MPDWNDLRFFLAAVQAGSYVGAGRKLRVDRTTVGRRVEVLERSLGTALFEQTASGYHPTAAGRLALQAAQRIEAEVLALLEALGRQQQQAQGELRLALPFELGEELLPEVLEFARAHPDIRTEVLDVGDPVLALKERKADLALVVGYAGPEHLAGVQIGPLPFAVYAARRYLQRVPAATALHEHEWIGWNEDVQESALARWMHRQLPSALTPRTRVNSWAALRAAVLAGLGVAAMWCPFADRERGLRRLRAPQPDQQLNLWLLGLQDIPPDASRRAALADLAPRLQARLRIDARASSLSRKRERGDINN